MPRHSGARQQHNHHQQQQATSFGASSDSSTSYLSTKSKAQSPRSNFNPFSPLSPHLAEKDLAGFDDESGAMFQMEDANGRATGANRASRVYSRPQLLAIARDCRQKGWVKPKGMGPLESWYGASTHPQDPAIASIGSAPNRKNGGFGEGFGYGGGIGGKGLNRGGRHAGPRRNDHETHHSTGPSKEVSGGGPMGKFAVKSTQDRMKLGGDENRKPKDDWRRDKPPHQVQRNDNRQWNFRHEEDTAEPAWMDDQPEHDPAIARSQDDSLVQFVPGEDMIAAHKRAMKGGAEGSERRPLVGFFNPEQPVEAPPKPIKEYNAANYLLPKKRVEPEATSSKENSSRFARFFGNPAQPDGLTASLVSPPPRPVPSEGPPQPLPPINARRPAFETNVTAPVPSPPPSNPEIRHANPALLSPSSQSPPPQNAENRTANLMRQLLGDGSISRPSSARRHSPPPPPEFHNQAGFVHMPAGYGMLPPNASHDSGPATSHFLRPRPPPWLGPPNPAPGPPPMFHQPQYQQGFLPPLFHGGHGGHGGQPPYHPLHPGFAPEQPHFHPTAPAQPLYAPQHPQGQQHMNALLHQWHQQPR